MGASQGQVKGTWLNRQTGEKITARDSYIDGDVMYVSTIEKGLIPMKEFSRLYVQMGDEDLGMQGVIPEQPMNFSSYSQPTTSDDGPIQPDFGVISKPKPVKRPVQKSYDEDDDRPKAKHSKKDNSPHNLLKQLFDKVESEPNIEMQIFWADFPAQQLKMLVDYFDVLPTDIASFIQENYLSEDKITESIASLIEAQINK